MTRARRCRRRLFRQRSLLPMNGARRLGCSCCEQPARASRAPPRSRRATGARFRPRDRGSSRAPPLARSTPTGLARVSSAYRSGLRRCRRATEPACSGVLTTVSLHVAPFCSRCLLLLLCRRGGGAAEREAVARPIRRLPNPEGCGRRVLVTTQAGHARCLQKGFEHRIDEVRTRYAGILGWPSGSGFDTGGFRLAITTGLSGHCTSIRL